MRKFVDDVWLGLLKSPAYGCNGHTSQFCGHSVAEEALRYECILGSMVPLGAPIVSLRVSLPASQCLINYNCFQNQYKLSLENLQVYTFGKCLVYS